MPKKRLQIIGHRGNGAGRGENTVASCRQAIKNGADAVELDVRLDGDTVITGHDPGDRADTLANILKHTKVPLILHVKEGPFKFPVFSWRYYRKLIDRVAPMVKGHDVILASFSPGALRYCRRKYPKIKTGFATVWPGYDLHLAGRVGSKLYCAYEPTITKRAARLAKRKGIQLAAIVKQNSLHTRRRIRELGITSVITDDVHSFANDSTILE